MKTKNTGAGARLDIPRLREMRITVSVLPTDENVDSMDMALAVGRALRGVAVVQAIRGGDVVDDRFDFPRGGYATDSLHRCRIPKSEGHGLMSEQDAAEELGVTKRTVQAWARAGRLASETYAGERRIPRSAVADLLADREGPDAQLDRIADKLATIRREVES